MSREVGRSNQNEKMPNCANYCVNDGPKLIVIIIWAFCTAGLFAERFGYYAQYINDPPVNDPDEQSRRALFRVMGFGLCFARAAAAAIKFNCALLLIFVLRNFLSWLRGTWFGTYFPVDKNIVFHKKIAWIVLFFGTVHTVAHFFNFYNICTADVALLQSAGLLPAGQTTRPTLLTLARRLAGWTGIIISGAMILMYSSAVDTVRRPSFESFWYTHHLFIVFYAGLIAHGMDGILEPANFWIWTIGPIVLYAIERTIRIFRGKQSCIITHAIAHPSRVLELRIKKQTFNYRPGQYVFVACPYIANYEWHPFTISSSPDEDFVSVHIRNAGDWTGTLHLLMNPNKKEHGVVQENMVTGPNGEPILLVDGPFGAASEDCDKFSTIQLWAAGIGVTPMASILKHIRHNIHNPTAGTAFATTRVDFFWINREKTSFEWFLDLLADLERTCEFLTIQLFFTGRVSEAEKAGNADGTDALTGLHSRTLFSRPDFDGIFAQKQQEFAGQRVGVFFCGPPIVSKKLYQCCRTYTDSASKTYFVYHKENF